MHFRQTNSGYPFFRSSSRSRSTPKTNRTDSTTSGRSLMGKQVELSWAQSRQSKLLAGRAGGWGGWLYKRGSLADCWAEMNPPRKGRFNATFCPRRPRCEGTFLKGKTLLAIGRTWRNVGFKMRWFIGSWCWGGRPRWMLGRPTLPALPPRAETKYVLSLTELSYLNYCSKFKSIW